MAPTAERHTCLGSRAFTRARSSGRLTRAEPTSSTSEFFYVCTARPAAAPEAYFFVPTHTTLRLRSRVVSQAVNTAKSTSISSNTPASGEYIEYININSNGSGSSSATAAAAAAAAQQQPRRQEQAQDPQGQRMETPFAVGA